MNNEHQIRYILDNHLKLGDRQMQSLSLSGIKILQNNLKLGNREIQHLIVYFMNAKVKLFRINHFFLLRVKCKCTTVDK